MTAMIVAGWSSLSLLSTGAPSFSPETDEGTLCAHPAHDGAGLLFESRRPSLEVPRRRQRPRELARTCRPPCRWGEHGPPNEPRAQPRIGPISSMRTTHSTGAFWAAWESHAATVLRRPASSSSPMACSRPSRIASSEPGGGPAIPGARWRPRSAAPRGSYPSRTRRGRWLAGRCAGSPRRPRGGDVHRPSHGSGTASALGERAALDLHDDEHGEGRQGGGDREVTGPAQRHVSRRQRRTATGSRASAAGPRTG